MRKVKALKFCVSKFTESLKSSRLKVLDKLKVQATEQPVMLTTVTGKSSIKESLEDRLRAWWATLSLSRWRDIQREADWALGLDRLEQTAGFESSVWAVGLVFTDDFPQRGGALSRGRREADQGQSPLELTESWRKMRAHYSPVPRCNLLIRKVFNN